MESQELVLVDTCIWVPYFNKPQSAAKRAVDELIDEDRAAIIGPILAEVLCGFRRDVQADWVASALRGLQYLGVSWEDWRTAAQLGRQLASRGHQLPLSDLALGAVALRRDCAVYTSDPHFDLIQHLKRFNPSWDTGSGLIRFRWLNGWRRLPSFRDISALEADVEAGVEAAGLAGSRFGSVV